MGKGSSGTNTVTQNSAPPPDVMANYDAIFNQANNVASTPDTPYSGSTIAGFTPEQQNAFANINTAAGLAQPYIQNATDLVQASTQPLWNSGLQALAPTAPQQFSAGAVNQYESPYTQQVVNATQAEFNNQNQTQAAGLTGNAVSQGAYGGDREAVAQSTLANQQQLAQAPVIAGLMNSGDQNALQEFNTQQQMQLAQSSQGMQEQGIQLGSNEAQAWLNSQGAAQLGALGERSAKLRHERCERAVASWIGAAGAGATAVEFPVPGLSSRAGLPIPNNLVAGKPGDRTWLTDGRDRIDLVARAECRLAVDGRRAGRCWALQRAGRQQHVQRAWRCRWRRYQHERCRHGHGIGRRVRHGRRGNCWHGWRSWPCDDRSRRRHQRSL